MSLRETDAYKGAIQEDNGLYSIRLGSDADDENETEEAEMIRAIMKIGEKVYSNGKPAKFPVPKQFIHLVLVDVRGFMGSGGDNVDYIQIANGSAEVPRGCEWSVHYWDGKPIRGLFESSDEHPLVGAACARERLHFVGFVNEKEYAPGVIKRIAYYRANPHLLADNDHILRLVKTFPLVSTK